MEKRSLYVSHKRWLLPIIVIFAAITITALLTAARGEPPKKAEIATATLVEVDAVDMRPLQLTVRSQGLVNPKYQTELVAQVSGEITQVADAFMRGGVVKQGELLATIDPTNYEVRVEEAKAQLASAQAALELERAQGQVAKVEWEKAQGTAAPALGLRKPQLAQAEAQVAAAQAALKQAEKDLSRTRVLAPYDALVAARAVSPGSFVNVGNQIGLVMDVRTAEIRLPIANSDLQYLHEGGVGAPVMLQGNVQGRTLEWDARVVRGEGVIDENSRMSYLVAEVIDPYHLYADETGNRADALRFGSFVVAQIQGLSLPQAVHIPRYLIRDGRVAVAQEGKLTFKPISVIRNVDASSIVVDGLATGDQLITTALEFPVEGMALDIRAVKAGELAAKPAEAAAEDVL
jgi:RND family efflux transporter MFP subunit